MRLALDISLGSLALVVERVEVLLKTGFGGDARVDGATKGDLALALLQTIADRSPRQRN
jgi:hypothetical protein